MTTSQPRKMTAVLLSLALLACGGMEVPDGPRRIEPDPRRSQDMVTVPDVTGLPRRRAVRRIRAADLEAHILKSKSASAKRPRGRVFRQNPEPGATRHEGDTVYLHVAVPPAEALPPSVATALEALRTYCFLQYDELHEVYGYDTAAVVEGEAESFDPEYRHMASLACARGLREAAE